MATAIPEGVYLYGLNAHAIIKETRIASGHYMVLRSIPQSTLKNLPFLPTLT